MFRQDEVIAGGWMERTIDAMQRRRFDAMVSRLSPLGAARLDALQPGALLRRLERCWQPVEIKPMRAQQLSAVRSGVLAGVQAHADCLCVQEHELVERALLLGGSAQIEDAQELEAAQALSLRLWGSVGLVSGRPYFELEPGLLAPIARAIAREEHEEIRARFSGFHLRFSGMLYQAGVIDDRIPQQMIMRDVLRSDAGDEVYMALARRCLWAGYDCIDYSGGVMLLHPALAEPRALLASGRRRGSLLAAGAGADDAWLSDILPEEIPLQQALERTIEPALRTGLKAQEVARSIRFLCKQGAPLLAMEEVLGASLIVLPTAAMRSALFNMYTMTPKWIECAQHSVLQ